ncbi:MAG: CRISPR-associated endonuclease Cas1 [Candidatus Marinimicrobia bacterium]|nr:CRISPR-associated endonuclease Cas1 [Candidatus Neomarinimicrobiota bacterium]
MIEPFRPYIDEVVIKLITTRQIKQAHFDDIPDGYTLNKEGKGTLIPAVNDFFEESIRYRSRNIKRKHTLQYECHRLANDWLQRDDDPDVNVVETRKLEEEQTD